MLTNSQLLSFIKNDGYKKTSDDLGIYFDKASRKFSCMKHGFNYICYHNNQVDNQWVLGNKSGILKDFSEALAWVVIDIQKSPL